MDNNQNQSQPQGQPIMPKPQAPAGNVIMPGQSIPISGSIPQAAPNMPRPVAAPIVQPTATEPDTVRIEVPGSNSFSPPSPPAQQPQLQPQPAVQPTITQTPITQTPVASSVYQSPVTPVTQEPVAQPQQQVIAPQTPMSQTPFSEADYAPVPPVPTQNQQAPPVQTQATQMPQSQTVAPTFPRPQINEISYQSPPQGQDLRSVLTSTQPTFAGTGAPPQIDGQESLPPKPPQQPASKSMVGGMKKKIMIALGGLGLLMLLLIGAALIKNFRANDLGSNEGEITWWGLDDEAVYAPLIAEYENSHPNTKINYIKQSEENYRERLTSTIARGQAPDIFEFHNSWVPMFRSNLSPLPSDVMTESEYAESFYPVVVADMTTTDGIVGIPLMFDALTMYINEDIFSSSASTPPVTWDNLRPLSLVLTQKGEQNIIKQSGVAIGSTQNIDYWEDIVALMMLQNNVDLSNPQGTLAEDVLLYYTKFTKVDPVWNDTLPESTVAFGKGSVAMYFAPSRAASQIATSNPSLRFKTVPVPQVRKDNPDEPDISYATYYSEGVWNKSKHRGLAWDFLKFMSSENSQQRIFEKRKEVNGFGLMSPLTKMNANFRSSNILGSVAVLAPYARSWYLAGKTNDGDTGINSQLSLAFNDALIGANSSGGTQITDVATNLATQVNQILAQYSLVQLIAPAK